MEQWKQYNIGEICDTISETYKGNASDVVLINTSDVLEGKCLNHTFVANKNLRGQFKKQFKKNDILYSEIRPANKRYAFIDFESTDYIASTKLMVIRSNDKVLPKYLYYVLQSKEMVEVLQMLAESRSGTFPQITFSELAIQTILLPEIREQSKIVDFLESIDSKIALNRRINDNLEQQAQALFKSWFVDFEPFGSGSMPDDWEICEAQKYFKINIGKTPPRNETKWFSKNIDDYKWASIADLGKCGLFISNTSEYLTKEAVNTFNIIIVPKGTVLLSFKLTLGRTAITTCPLTTNEAIARFLVNNDYEREYLYLLLRQYDYTSLGNTSSIATAVNSKIIKNMPIMMPPIDILQQFHTVVSPLFNRMQSLSDELTQLAETRDTLLPRLMSGELKISETETQTTNHG